LKCEVPPPNIVGVVLGHSNKSLALADMQEFLSDPLVMGALTWIGFVVTLLGLAIAIWQIMQLNTATKAAAAAIESLTTIVHSRERLLDLSSALRMLDSARHHIAQQDYSKAIIFLEFARGECVQVREIATESASQRQVNNMACTRFG
jgi:hypothetical protein